VFKLNIESHLDPVQKLEKIAGVRFFRAEAVIIDTN
jgi:hypothetical protein